jgi:hypothetical protein
MVDIESKILRVAQSAVFTNVFLATAPNYTDQPEIALEHVFQVMTDTRFIAPSRYTTHYPQILAALSLAAVH